MSDILLRLAMTGLHPDRMRRLLGDLGPAGAVTALSRGTAEAPDTARRAVAISAGDHRSRLRELGVGFVVRDGEGYPEELAGLPDAPPWLFTRGSVPPGPAVAVVGSRRATSYGLGIARRLGAAVASAGWPVVSGLAAGVDGAAHRGCLDAGGVGVAVLGSGIDVWYPARHRALGEEVLAGGGGVVSEFPPGTPPEAWRFPCRNRIISGLSRVVVVVEAAARSGALITARLAVDQGREVFAVPGDLDRATSAGCNLLIRDGAHPVADLEAVVEELELVLGPAPRHPSRAEGPSSDAVLDGIVGPVSTPIDQVVERSGRPAGEVLAELSRLEVEGRVEISDGAVRAV